MTEAELLHDIKINSANFSALFNIYYQPIFGYIFRRTGNFNDAADIAADTFCKAFRHIQNFSYKGISIKVWLYRIATNEVNLYFRQLQKNNSVFNKIDAGNKELFKNYIQHDKEEMEAEMQLHQQFLTVLEALKRLPVKYQEVISLRYFEGKNNKEIAEILNINEGTLKSLVSRGIKKLRKKCNQF